MTPLWSRHTLGAWNSVPSDARTVTHGEYVTPFGTATQRPSSQYHRPWRSTHSPSTQASAPSGCFGIDSTRPGGGVTSIAVSAFGAWGDIGGGGGPFRQAANASIPVSMNQRNTARFPLRSRNRAPAHQQR